MLKTQQPESKIHLMIHHNDLPRKGNKRPKKIILAVGNIDVRPYGVSSTYRILTKGRYLKNFDQVRDCLMMLGFTVGEREVALRLLNFWAHYGIVYPKQEQVSAIAPGCSKSTFWRTINKLEDRGLIEVFGRYIAGKKEEPEKAQTSDLYRLDALLLVIARYLAEKGVKFYEEWLKPIFTINFWERFNAGEDPLLFLNRQQRLL